MKLSSEKHLEKCLRYFLHLEVSKEWLLLRTSTHYILILEVNYVIKLYADIQMNYAFTYKALKNMRSTLTLPSR